MLPGAEVSMLDDRTADKAHPFVAVIDIDTPGQMFVIPFLWKKPSAAKMVIDFGDGDTYESDGDILATLSGSESEGRLDNVFSHSYEEPGRYVLTIDYGAERIGFSGCVWQSYVYWLSPDAGTVNVVRCALELGGAVFSDETVRKGNPEDSGTQFAGMGWISSFTCESVTNLGWNPLDPPRKLVLPNMATNTKTWSGVIGFAGKLEEIWAPKWNLTSQWTAMGSNAQRLRLAYLPKWTSITRSRAFSRFSEGADIYLGKITQFTETALRDVFSSKYSVHGDIAETYETKGCTLNLHVPMTSAAFKALAGWLEPERPGSPTHPWGSEYLKIFATDATFDTNGAYFRADGRMTDANGVLLNDQYQWINEYGHTTLSDGHTLAIWRNGEIFRCDWLDRPIDKFGNYIDWDNKVVSDCFRKMTSNGRFVDDDGNIESREYEFIAAKGHLSYEEYAERPWMPYDCVERWDRYVMPVVIRGVTYNTWEFFDETRRLRWYEPLNLPDGKVEYVGVRDGAWVQTGIIPTGRTRIVIDFIAGNLDNSGFSYIPTVEDLTERGYHGLFGFLSDSGEDPVIYGSGAPYQWYDGADWKIGSVAFAVGGRIARDDRPVTDLFEEFEGLRRRLEFGNLYVKDLKTGAILCSEDPFTGMSFSKRIVIGGRGGAAQNFRLFRLTVYEGDAVVADFVPYSKSGVGALLDLVSGVVHETVTETETPTEYERWATGPFLEVD